jgi:hypothetical protein
MSDRNINADMNHRSFLDVPIGNLIGDAELTLDIDAIGQPGPFDNMLLVASTLEDHDGKTTHTIRVVDQVTKREVVRAFEKQPPAPGDNDAAWRRTQ